MLKVRWVFLPIDRTTGTTTSEGGLKLAFKELPNFYSCMGVKQIGELSAEGIQFSTISLVEAYESRKVSVTSSALVVVRVRLGVAVYCDSER